MKPVPSLLAYIVETRKAGLSLEQISLELGVRTEWLEMVCGTDGFALKLAKEKEHGSG